VTKSSASGLARFPIVEGAAVGEDEREAYGRAAPMPVGVWRRFTVSASNTRIPRDRQPSGKPGRVRGKLGPPESWLAAEDVTKTARGFIPVTERNCCIAAQNGRGAAEGWGRWIAWRRAPRDRACAALLRDLLRTAMEDDPKRRR
jgi:hypothetical protein